MIWVLEGRQFGAALPSAIARQHHMGSSRTTIFSASCETVCLNRVDLVRSYGAQQGECLSHAPEPGCEKYRRASVRANFYFSCIGAAENSAFRVLKKTGGGGKIAYGTLRCATTLFGKFCNLATILRQPNRI